MSLVECVPNVSEGRDRHAIDSMARAIASVPGVALLDVDAGWSANRTVYTFAGEGDAVLEAAFRLVDRASKLIDMRSHVGTHPRLGATDVCPFVPLSGTSMGECIDLAGRLALRVGSELDIPVYLYAEAARFPERKSLTDVRRGQYELLSARIQSGFTPDFGPARLHPIAGATVIGARRFLIAYNVNLNTASKDKAELIASKLREKGTALRDSEGRVLRDEEGSIVRAPGGLKSVRAIGWVVEEYGLAQVSMNLTDYTQISLEHVYEECARQAERLGISVTGSEIVGMVPLEAVVQAGRHFLARKTSPALKEAGEKDLVQAAVRWLGLEDVRPFDPETKIIEYALSRSQL